MASLKLMLGMIPSTSKIEKEEKDLISEYEKLKVFSDSELLKRYYELNKTVTSSTFIQKRKEIESLKYKGSEDYILESEYKSLVRARDIILYFKTLSGSELKRFKEIEKSDKISSFEKLEKLVKSPEFIGKSKTKEFKGSEEYKKVEEYKRLKGSSEIKEFYKFGSSKEYSNYLNMDGSARLARYQELKVFVADPAFAERKSYLLDRKRFEKSDMFKQAEEYEKLVKNEDIVWYFKVKDSDKFDIIKTRELTFSDEFEGEKLDTSKWITNYYWGEKLLKDRFSVESDLQAYTEKENFEIRNSLLRIYTKPQKVKGKAWSASKGFTTKEFGFTSGIINTGNSFRQKYGVFTAKIKLGDPDVKNAFWMLSDKITPHIDICHTGKGKVWFDYFNGNGQSAKTSLGSKYANDFFIYSLEWSADMLVWKINGVETFRQTTNVPKEPMYVILSGSLDKPVNQMTSMDIDWIRVYKS